MGGGERVNDGHIDCEAATETPILDGDVSGSTTGLVGRTKDTKLLQLGREEAGICELEDEVSHVVVSRNSVTGLLAAERVIAKQIHFLLAKRTRGRRREHGLTEETGNGSAKDFGRKDGVFAIHA